MALEVVSDFVQRLDITGQPEPIGIFVVRDEGCIAIRLWVAVPLVVAPPPYRELGLRRQTDPAAPPVGTRVLIALAQAPSATRVFPRAGAKNLSPGPCQRPRRFPIRIERVPLADRAGR